LQANSSMVIRKAGPKGKGGSERTRPTWKT